MSVTHCDFYFNKLQKLVSGWTYVKFDLFYNKMWGNENYVEIAAADGTFTVNLVPNATNLIINDLVCEVFEKLY